MSKSCELFQKRVEKKFVDDEKKVISLRDKLINSNKFKIVGEIFDDETNKSLIKNVYFDSYGLDSYHKSVDGTKDRTKIRIRTYVNKKGNKKSFLEIKRKSQGVTEKDRIKLDPNCVDQIISRRDFSVRDIIEYNKGHKSRKEVLAFLERISNYVHVKNFFPVLETSYRRRSFKGYDDIGQKVRLTIDTDLTFTRLGKSAPIKIPYDKSIEKQMAILELKAPSTDETELMRVIKNGIGESVGFSKYCFGVFSTEKDNSNTFEAVMI